MPKFSFPIPGRRSNKNKVKETEKATSYAKPATSPSAVSNSGSSFSKAQRFFGTDNDLNIDSPTRDDDSWMVPSSRSSVMSISISESTHSTRTTNDTVSIHGSQADKWESESGIFPRVPRLHGKASSTVLGMRYGDDEDSMSNMSARLRNEDSSSTLKSYYDRQTSPLAISQQTSASSARDLALRKGLPPVVSKSPLLQVESVDILDSSVTGHGSSVAYKPKERDPRKKPAKLDFSMLFPKPRSGVGKSPVVSSSPTPSSMLSSEPSAAPSSSRRKLTKTPSKESLRSQQSTTRSIQPQVSRLSQINGPQYQPYDHYQQSPVRPAQMDQIPESRVPEPRSAISQHHLEPPARNGQPIRKREQQSYSGLKEQIQSTSVPCPWETSSTTSASSHNTKASKRTSTSTFSNADLKEKSVLSLSSGSEGEDSDVEPMLTPATPSNDKASRVLNGQSLKYNGNARLSTQQNVIRPQMDQASHFRSITETSIPDPRLSGPWVPPQEVPHRLRDQKHSSRRPSVKQTGNEQQHTVQRLAIPKDVRHSITQPRDSRKSTQLEKSVPRKPSISSQRSQRSSLQPTPPLSPSSVEFRADPEHSNRFMAVTKQEEALLEALRQKRAKMREKIIEEHETGHRSPPRTAEEIKATRYSETSSISTYRGSTRASKQTVLMYLDTPVQNAQQIYTAEPSPDLSDFLGFGSDEDSTPRTSWAAPRKPGAPRPDSTISPTPRLDKLSPVPMTPTSVARLSAVGAVNGFKEGGRTPSVKKKTSSVRFTEDTRSGAFDDEEDDDGVIWGM